MGLRGVLAFLLPVSLLVAAGDARAQAWLPPRGEVFLSMDYQFLTADRHLFSTAPIIGGVKQGTRSLDVGTIQSQVLVLDGDLGVTRRLAANAAVAFVNSRFVAGGTHGPLDDGHWHGDFQDARVGARFMALNDGSWVLTPAVSYGFPTTNYATLGHAALGRRLKELRLGLDWGRYLSRRAYLEGNFSYAFMENVGDIPLDRSNLSLEFGYFVNHALTLQAWTAYQNVHGGLDWATDVGPHEFDPSHEDFDEELLLDHDRTAASDFWRIGVGVSFQVTERVELYANVAKTLWGINTHNALTVSCGMSWGFDLFGHRGLGVWEQRDDPNADLDDWLLQDLDRDGRAGSEEEPAGDTAESADEDQAQDAREGTSSRGGVK